jgi:hypothetical protein
VLDAVGLGFFASHARVRRAWAARYRLGAARRGELPATLRPRYLADPACLDAWVERRAAAAAEAFARIDTVHQRRVHIGLPVLVGPREASRSMSEPKQNDLRLLLERPVALLAIVGEGGSGKSSLACQIGFWALSEAPHERLAPHRILPVFLEEEVTDLVGSAAAQLRRMVGAEEAEDDVVAALLGEKRLLVMVDALSERSAPTQEHIRAAAGTAGVNALVVTSRRTPDFGPLQVALLRPEKVTVETLVYFLTEYLRRSGADHLFPGREALHLADRLLAVVERGSRSLSVTPLLITLFVDQAVRLRRQGADLAGLPVSVAEVMLEFVRHTNPGDPDTPNRVPDEVLVEAARALAAHSLADYVPRDFVRDGARATLETHGIDADDPDVVRRLVDNGVLEERDRGGTRFLRFDLDPVAEYMAALYWLDAHRADPSAWAGWLGRLAEVRGFPTAIEGFLVALEDCVLTYGRDFGLDGVALPWESGAYAPAGG